MMGLSDDTVVVTARGMSSSLGAAVTASAAIRAGLSSRAELDDLFLRDENGLEGRAMVHAIPTIAGFQGYARLAMLAWNALEDLLAQVDRKRLDAGGTGFFLATPFLGPNAGQYVPRDGAARICERLDQLAGFATGSLNWQCITLKQGGFAQALALAIATIRAHKYERCLVGGVDSLLIHSTFQALVHEGRFKTGTRQDGIAPGEASAFVLLERLGIARRRACEPLASFGEIVVLGESAEYSSEGFAHAIVQVARKDSRPWIITDHNGESLRALDWGNTLVHLAGRGSKLVDTTSWVPAAHLGDVGAATGPVGICLAIHAWARGYAPSRQVLIASAAREGRQSVFGLEAIRRSNAPNGIHQ